MYVAACCCGGDPGPVCDCLDAEDTRRGKMSFFFARRTSTYITSDRCISKCEIHDSVYSWQDVDYCEVEVPMKCVGGTRYIADVDVDHKTSGKILKVKTRDHIQFSRCWVGICPCDRIDRVYLDSQVINISQDFEYPSDDGQPVGVLDAVLVGGDTQIYSPAAFQTAHNNLLIAYENEYGEPFEIKPDKFYRVTAARIQYDATVFVTDFTRIFENGSEVSFDDDSGDQSFTYYPLGYFLNSCVAVCELDECDVRDYGQTMFTCIRGQSGSSILPVEEFVETIVYTPSTCFEQPGFACCPSIPAYDVDGEVRIDTNKLVGAINRFEVVDE